jgi:hypothetical protein
MAITGTLSTGPRNELLPASAVPCAGSGAGSVVVVVVDVVVVPAGALDGPVLVEPEDGRWFTEQALASSATASDTPTVRGAVRLGTRPRAVASCRPRRACLPVTASDDRCDEIGVARWGVSTGR